MCKCNNYYGTKVEFCINGHKKVFFNSEKYLVHYKYFVSNK